MAARLCCCDACVRILYQANSGKNSNGSQFFITLKATKHLDGKHVVFGRLVEGEAVLRRMEAVGSKSGAPSKEVTVVDCGQLEVRYRGQ